VVKKKKKKKKKTLGMRVCVDEYLIFR